MKRTYFKVQLAVILLCGLFAVATISSCDKAKKLNGTTWTGDYEDEDWTGDIELSFSGDAVDVTAKISNRPNSGGQGGYYDDDDDDWYYYGTKSTKATTATTYRGECTFTCDKL